MRHYRNYFLDGTLPEWDEFLCEVDEGYFPGGEGEVARMHEGDEEGLGDVARGVKAAWDAWMEGGEM